MKRSAIVSVPTLISRVLALPVSLVPPAKVVVNERTGTIVMGGNVTLSTVAVLHGNLSIDVTTDFAVSQPTELSQGRTVVVPQSKVKADETSVRVIRMKEGASIDELVSGLHTMGATARDIISILQAIKAAGGLHADLEVL